MKLFPFLLLPFLLILQGGCGEMDRRFESRPNALGKSNEIVVICDQNIWEGVVGDSLQYFFASAYPIMPQPEPLFDLRHFTTEELFAEETRRELRTYLIIANLADKDSPTADWVKKDLGPEKLRRQQEDESYFSSIGRDKWARGQLLIYLFGEGQDAIADNVVRGFPTIARMIREHDRNQIDASAFLEGENIRLIDTLRAKHNIRIRIPGDFQLALSTGEFTWLRKDTREITSSLIFSGHPYDDAARLSRDTMIAIRNRLGRFVTTDEEGSYMRTNVEDLPVNSYDVEIDGNFAREIRGVWEMENDFLGGPFVSYAILYPDRTRILFIDAFVFAPGKDKRNIVQQLEYIIRTIEFL